MVMSYGRMMHESNERVNQSRIFPIACRTVAMPTHGGTLEIESVLGNGTTVTLHFPAHRVIDAAAIQGGTKYRLSA